jgi:hypothetical protein
VEKHHFCAGVFELHDGRPQDVQTALAGGVGNNVDFLRRHFSPGDRIFLAGPVVTGFIMGPLIGADAPFTVTGS